MKNIILVPVLIAFFSTTVIKGQSIFERYANADDVSLVSISPKMFKMLGQISIGGDDPEAQEYLEMVSSINNFKVLISGNDEVNAEISRYASKEFSSYDLEELMTVKDADTDVTFYVKSGKSDDRVEKLIMYVKGVNSQIIENSPLNGRSIETILMIIEGDIDLNKISKLTDKMNLPGGKQLKKAQRQKSIL
jgi:calcineurin-like phosphoesterase family protein